MFTTRLFILLMYIGSLIYDTVLARISDQHRNQPLPNEVADVYEPERYKTFINFEADKKKLQTKYKAINLIINVILIFSPIYTLIDNWCNHNPYLIVLATYSIIFISGIITEIAHSYEFTFKVMEKYGLNKSSLKTFIKDEILELTFTLVASIGLLELFAFIGEHLGKWTNNYAIGYFKSSLILLGICIVVVLFIIITQLISYTVLKKQYTFTELEDGVLKDKINTLQASSKKKVKTIYVYDESKKSTTKNAFLLKLFWHREFGIADNFINENAEDELLAVVSHEIGHLKHKKNIFNFINYFVIGLLFIALLFVVVNPNLILSITEWTRNSFRLTANNYYIIATVFIYILKPIFFVLNTFSMYVSRREEYEADQEAVTNGYAEPLIKMFKTLSNDELIDVNPHPLIEFIEDDHPGMYQRIKAIRKADQKIS